MIAWLTKTAAGKFVATFFISMVPVIELRAGLPYGIALGLKYPAALLAAVLGNMLPAPFIIIYIRKIFAWLRSCRGVHSKKNWFDRFLDKMESKADTKGQLVQKYGPIALIILVGIPLPGTGAWTGSLVAALLNIDIKRAVPAVFAGVLLAALIMTIITYGVIWIV